VHGTGVDLSMLFVLPTGGSARYDCAPEASLAAVAAERGVSAAAAFIELLLETDGMLVCNLPFLNQRLDAVEEMLDDPLVTLGLADAGAHVGQIMDASQPTFYLSYWVVERRRWSLEEAIRRLTSDTADLFGIRDRGAPRRGVRRRQRDRHRRAHPPSTRVRVRLPARRRALRAARQRLRRHHRER
jgi:N-acyl-D-amino-acid deacylase